MYIIDMAEDTLAKKCTEVPHDVVCQIQVAMFQNMLLCIPREIVQ